MVSAGGALKVGQLFAALGLDDSEYNKGLDAAERRAKGFGGGVQAASLGAASAIAAVGVAAGVGLYKAVTAAADYQFAISAVGAVAGASAEELKGLNDTGLRIGRETAFSALEAASAMEILAANGVSVRDIMGGAADAAVALAAAGGVDLRTAADLASTSMTVWGLSTDNMTDVVNRLAGAANVSRFGVQDMAMAVAQGGGAAALAGVEFGDFTSAIAAIAPSFASGSDAGTSFKTFLNGLTPSTDRAREAMSDLGIITADGTNRFFTAEGQLRSMADVVGILHDATAGLSEEQKSQALTTIFGTDAMRAAGALSRKTREDFVALDSIMANTDAAEVARKRLDNLKGALEALKGSIETIAIEIGTVFLPILQEVAKWLAEKLPIGFDWLKANLPLVTAVLAGVGAALGVLLLPALKLVVGSLTTLMGPLMGSILPFLGVASAIGLVVAGAVLLVRNWDTVTAAFPPLGQAVDGVLGFFRDLASFFETGFSGGKIFGDFSSLEGFAFNAGGKLREFLDAAGEVAHFFQVGLTGGQIFGQFSELQTTAFNAGGAVREGLLTALRELGQGLQTVGGFLSTTVLPALGAVASFVASTVVAAFQGFIGLIQGWLLPLLAEAAMKFNNDVMPALANVGKGIALVAGAIYAILKPALELIVMLFGVVVTVVTENAGRMVAVLAAAWSAIWSAISLVLELIRDTVSIALALLRGDWEGAWHGLETLVTNVMDNMWGIITGVLETIKEAFSLAFGIIASTIKGIIEGVGKWLGERFGEWISGIGGMLAKIPEAAYSVLGLNKDDIVGKLQGPKTDMPANLTDAARGPLVANAPGYMGGPMGTPWAGPPVQMPNTNVVTIERMDVGVRPDIPGGVNPAPIRAALEEIDFSKWEDNSQEAGR